MSGDVTYVLADVIIFVYEVPWVFWQYVNADEVSLITLKKLLQSAMDSYYELRKLFYYKVRWIYYKLRQVLQSAMISTNCDSTYSARATLQHVIKVWWKVV